MDKKYRERFIRWVIWADIEYEKFYTHFHEGIYDDNLDARGICISFWIFFVSIHKYIIHSGSKNELK